MLVLALRAEVHAADSEFKHMVPYKNKNSLWPLISIRVFSFSLSPAPYWLVSLTPKGGESVNDVGELYCTRAKTFVLPAGVEVASGLPSADNGRMLRN